MANGLFLAGLIGGVLMLAISIFFIVKKDNKKGIASLVGMAVFGVLAMVGLSMTPAETEEGLISGDDLEQVELEDEEDSEELEDEEEEDEY